MHRLVGVVAALLLALPAAWADDKPRDKPDTPAEQYRALVKEYQTGVLGNKSPDEKARLAEDYASKFLDLAEKNPRDPAAVDALAWVVRNVRGAGKDNPRTRALGLLARDHADRDKLGPLCQRLARTFDKPSADFLRAVMEHSPSKEVRGQACAALVQHLDLRDQYAERLKDQPGMEPRLEELAGKDAVAELKKLDPEKADAEREQVFRLAADKYADVKMAKQTLGEVAEAGLFEVQHLRVGKEAADIQGEDLDGKPLKLSDYKGKVVVLDFWGNW